MCIRDSNDTSSAGSQSSSKSATTSKNAVTESKDATEGNVDFEVYNVALPKVPAATIPATSSIAKVLYVSPEGSLTGDGTIEKPFNNLKIAIDKAARCV